MAEMLRDSDSTERHLNQARRHQRRGRKTSGAASLADAIEPPRAALEAAAGATLAAEREEDDAADDLELAGTRGADVVRNLSAAAKEHDRNHPGEGVHAAVIGDGFGDYLHDDGTVEATTLEALAAKVAVLGEGHALAGRKGELTAAAEAIRAAEAAQRAAVQKRAVVAAHEELAQAALRRAYEANYLDARKQLGRELAERLFPRNGRRKKAAEPAPPPTPA